jgi:hypothetical protein
MRAGREFSGHVGQHPLNRLIVRDRLAELLPLLRVRDRLVERRLTDTERLRRDGDASALQRPHRQVETLVDVPEHLIVGDRRDRARGPCSPGRERRANRPARSA